MVSSAAGASAQPARYEYPFQDPDRPVEERISDLVSRMTLDEKIDCLANRAAVPRLGVKGSPHIEGYHGVAQGGPSNWGRRNPTATTQFPQAYGLGATWDPELVRKVAAQEAQEARYLYQSESVQPLGPDRAGTQRRPRARSRAGAAPRRSTARTRSWSARWRSPSRADCKATTRATGRPPRCSSTSSPTATRTAARARPRTSTSGCGASTTRSPSRWASARAARAR